MATMWSQKNFVEKWLAARCKHLIKMSRLADFILNQTELILGVLLILILKSTRYKKCGGIKLIILEKENTCKAMLVFAKMSLMSMVIIL